MACLLIRFSVRAPDQLPGRLEVKPTPVGADKDQAFLGTATPSDRKTVAANLDAVSPSVFALACVNLRPKAHGDNPFHIIAL
jgi:hypothetical protein